MFLKFHKQTAGIFLVVVAAEQQKDLSKIQRLFDKALVEKF